MRRAVAHHFLVCAEVNRQAHAYARSRNVGINVSEAVFRHIQRRVCIIVGVNGALVVKDRLVVLAAVPQQLVKVGLKNDPFAGFGGVASASASASARPHGKSYRAVRTFDRISLAVNQAALFCLLKGLNNSSVAFVNQFFGGVVKLLFIFFYNAVRLNLTYVIRHRRKQQKADSRQKQHNGNNQNYFFPHRTFPFALLIVL